MCERVCEREGVRRREEERDGGVDRKESEKDGGRRMETRKIIAVCVATSISTSISISTKIIKTIMVVLVPI